MALETNDRNAPFPLLPQASFYAKGRWNQRGLQRLPEELKGLLAAGWVVQKGEQIELTDRRKEKNTSRNK